VNKGTNQVIWGADQKGEEKLRKKNRRRRRS
jgi:hypothetical protein